MKPLNIFLLLLLSLILVAGCGRTEKFGKEIITSEVTKIGNITSKPDKYIDKIVKVEGEITGECPTGCWFYLKDDTGTIYVDIESSNLTIPQRTGSKAIVEGEVKSKEGRVEIIGKGVRIEK